MSNEKFKPPYPASKSLSPKLVELKQGGQAAFAPKNVVNSFIVYELDSWPQDLNTDFALGCCLYEGFKLTKNTDPDKYSYSSYDIGFNRHIEYSLLHSSVGKNVIIFGADMSLSVHIDIKVAYVVDIKLFFCGMILL